MARVLRCVCNPWWQPPTRACEGCGGKGFFHMIVDKVDYGQEECDACHGVGSVPDRPAWADNENVQKVAGDIYARGAWDEVWALKDTLEEAGCPEKEKQTVKAGDDCLLCGKRTRQAGEGFRPEARYCEPCCRTWVRGEHYLWPMPHPILAHLRDGGPHCRGCWAVDFVLGRE